MLNRFAIHRAALAVAATAFVVLSAPQAQAGQWTATGSRGRTYTHSSYHNGNGNFGRTNTVSGPRGTVSRQITQTNNGNGSFSRSVSVTRTPHQ